MRFRTLSLVFIAVVLCAAGVFAQGVQTATVTGTVTDEDGGALPGVTVTASSKAQMGDRTAITGGNGEYLIRGLTPGDYKVSFALEGMKNLDRQVSLPLGATTRLDTVLQLATATATITVTAAQSVLETTTVGANFTKDRVDTLPLIRTPTGIASLAGAVTDRTPVAGQLSINGGMAYDNSFLINGVNFQDPIFGSTNNLFIEDSILETQVLSSGISAEYGSFTGGVLNVITKSGGNDFAGTLNGAFSRPEWRDETPYEDGFRGVGVTPAKPIPRIGKLGEIYTVTLGGPFVRDRLWFFGAVRDTTDTSTYTLPIGGLVPRVIDNRRIEGKLTGNLTAKHSLQASYIDNPDNRNYEIQAGIAPLTLDALGVDSVRENDGKVISYNGVLTSRMFAEARYSEKHFGFRGLGGTSRVITDSPIRTFSYQGNPITGNYNAPYWDATDPEDRDNKVLYGALSYFLGTSNMGNHDMKGGVEKFTVTRTGGNSQTASDYVFYTPYKLDAAGAPVLTDGRLTPVFNADTHLGWWISTRGAKADVTTTSFFINDRWDLNANWSFNVGVRHEIVDSEATGNITSVDTTNTVPRLGASFDPMGNGKYKLDVTYSQYAGRYNPAITASNTPVGNPALLYGYYNGPAGEGRDFAPGWDPSNYVFYYADVPTANIFMAKGLSAPVQHEITFSGGMQFSQNGYAKLTFVDRNLKGVIEDFVTIDQGCSQVVFEGIDAGCFDNIFYENSDVPERKYQAVEIQSRYSITNNWAVEGNYTHQFKNDGNYEGEGGQSFGATPIGDRPEISSPRQYPTGRLSQFEEDKIRLWTTYNLDFGRFGKLSPGLIWSYDSPRTHSYSVANVARTSTMLARNPGYQSTGNITLFFGDRGVGEYNATSLFDLSVTYGVPVYRTVEPWVRFDVRNLLNDDTLIQYNTTILRNGTDAASVAACGGPCPVDSDGLSTTYRKGPAFGRPRGVVDYVTPREYLLSAGIRF